MYQCVEGEGGGGKGHRRVADVLVSVLLWFHVFQQFWLYTV